MKSQKMEKQHLAAKKQINGYASLLGMHQPPPPAPIPHTPFIPHSFLRYKLDE